MLDAIMDGEFSVSDKGPPRTKEYKETYASFMETWDRLQQSLSKEQQEQLEKLLSSKELLLGMEAAEQRRIAFAAGMELQREIQEIVQRFDCQ